jgi:hypothetical protein
MPGRPDRLQTAEQTGLVGIQWRDPRRKYSRGNYQQQNAGAYHRDRISPEPAVHALPVGELDARRAANDFDLRLSGINCRSAHRLLPFDSRIE